MTPDQSAALRGIIVALGVGLLIGLERERRKGEGADRAPAGIRTFALAALLGALGALVPLPGAFPVAATFVGAIALLGYARRRRADPGITGEVALVVTFLLGALAVAQPVLAGGLGAAVAILLASRNWLHRFVHQVLTAGELHDALVFAAAALVVLPLLPAHGIGPGGALNPRTLWRLVVLVMAIGGLGHVAGRTLGVRHGLALAGFLGGFVSSTATIGALGARARREPAVRGAATAGAVLSTVATVVQMAIVLAATSLPVLAALVPALVPAGLAALAYAGVVLARVARADGRLAGAPRAKEPAMAAGRAFDLRSALVFGLTLGAVSLLSAWLTQARGAGGLALVTAVAGLADTHAAAIGAASMARVGAITPAAAVVPILLGFSTNTVGKSVAALAAGGRQFALATIPGLVLVAAGAWLGALLLRG